MSEYLPHQYDPEHVTELVEKIKPILAYEGHPTQGAVLADLLAIWLAGTVVTDNRTNRPDAQETRRLRERLLRMHINMTKQLIEPNAQLLGTPV